MIVNKQREPLGFGLEKSRYLKTNTPLAFKKNRFSVRKI